MKKKFVNSGMRAGAVAMALVLGSGSMMLGNAPVAHAQEISAESAVDEQAANAITQKSVILNVGNDERSRNLTWYADTDSAGEVQYAPKAFSVNGEFPTEYQTSASINTAANDAGFYSNQAVLSGLQENTEYVYRVKNGENISNVYSFKTGSFDGSFKFAFVGDPQIGAGSTASDIEGWKSTLDTMSANFNPEFLLSAGDQVNTATNESQYAGYLNDIFTSLPSATSIGNHDSGSRAYAEHFNLPNESTEYGATTAGTDYWFVYGNTLFMDINSNDRSTAEHKAFMEEAIAANPDVTWKTVVFHHSIYSTASHWKDSDIVARRNELPQVFDELDIDVVLMGHDHVYTRTYMMNGFTPDNSQGVQSEVTDPTGILYLTANSASGSKYYGIANPEADYSAKMDQSQRRTLTDVTVTDTSYTVTTYFADDMSLLDTFTIHKTPELKIASVENKNKQSSVYFDIANANGKGYVVYLSETGEEGSFAPYDNVNYNAKGAHIRGLENGKTYYAKVANVQNGSLTQISKTIELLPAK